MNGASASFLTRFPLALVLLGVALRLPGLLFNGMSDLNEILLDWGAAVHRLGLLDAFGVNYGILSYAAFGIAEAAGEWIPRFWWAPYKLLVIASELGVYLALLALVERRDRRRLTLLVWLNPWFILHGAYHGFWEGPHILFGLLAVLSLRRIRDDRRAWAIAGALIACSAMVKPQGLIHFAVPLGLFLGVEYLRGKRGPLVAYLTGLAGAATVVMLLVWLAGGPVFALFSNYRSASTVMANLSNGGPGLWRFLSWAYMQMMGQPGQVYDLHISSSALAAWKGISGAICLAILVAFAARLGLQRRGPGVSRDEVEMRSWMPVAVMQWPAAVAAFAFLTLGALVVSQFGPHAHINHSYPAMVLLTPWVLCDRKLARLWLATIVMLGLAHLSAFRFGDAHLMLPASQLFKYPHAGPLIERVIDLPAYRIPDGLLTIQATANRAYLLTAQAVSMMSALVCIAACGIIWRLSRILTRPTNASGEPERL